ncbi:MAG TPA: ectonucleotide pyrophosphatase/phosphodiesterase [Puia sp.]|jgi:predicted AlkP superfamily pyrophosphatase or phosphodiesterase
MRITFCLLLSLVLFGAIAQKSSGSYADETRPLSDSSLRVVPGRTNSAEQQKKPYVIFISADGFRYDLADKYQATNLLALREKGVAAKSMIPSYPSVTFPNHYSLATGLYPSHHGLVDNTFFDPKKGKGYAIGNRSAVEDSSWYGGVPIWVLAEQQQMVSASFFWVGSEAAVDGVRPTYYYRFNDKIPMNDRLQKVKEWLTMPESRRPHLILFYMSQVDHAEHMYGPDSKQAEEAVHLIDDVVGRMTRMVDSLGLPVNYVFVADHGMAQVDTLHGIGLPAAVDTTKFVLAPDETELHLYAKNKKDIAPAYRALKAAAKDFDVYLLNEVPARWHYSSADDRFGRIGDIILVAHFPKVFNLRGRRIIPGMHGFDNMIPEMGATFYAWGPAFKPHQKIGSFENVNVYPMIARILGLKITSPVDGKVDVLAGTLK